jgi:Zn-dependent protease
MARFARQTPANLDPTARGWRAGEIGGVEVRVDPSLLLIAALVTFTVGAGILPREVPRLNAALYWLFGAAAACIFILSILWHEMAHALMALRYRVPVKRIVLHLFGGVAFIARDPERPAHEFWIAVVGPLSSLALAFLFGALGNLPDLTGAVCRWLALINLTLALFNLLPGFPLDGGRVLRAMLWHFNGSYRKATRQASRVGQAMAALFVVFALLLFLSGFLFNALWFVLIASFLYGNASLSYRMSQGGLPNEAPLFRVLRHNVPLIDARLPLALLVWRYLDHAPDQAFPVFRDGALIGMITAAQVERVPRLDWGRVRAGDVMLPLSAFPILFVTEPLERAKAQLDAYNVDHAPVFDGAQFVGMVNRRDIVYRT